MMRGRRNIIKVNWVPGHKGIDGNELADQRAKQSAKEMRSSDVKVPQIWGKRKEAFQEMKNQAVENGIIVTHVQRRNHLFMKCFRRLRRGYVGGTE